MLAWAKIMRSYLNKKIKAKRAESMVQVVECLLCKHRP
jgi:hypothetical protein